MGNSGEILDNFDKSKDQRSFFVIAVITTAQMAFLFFGLAFLEWQGWGRFLPVFETTIGRFSLFFLWCLLFINLKIWNTSKSFLKLAIAAFLLEFLGGVFAAGLLELFELSSLRLSFQKEIGRLITLTIVFSSLLNLVMYMQLLIIKTK